MEKTKTPIKAYLKSLPEESRADLTKLDKLITAALPDAKKVMWEGVFWGGTNQRIIGYGDISYTGSNKKTVEWFIVGLALQKNYITVTVSTVDVQKFLKDKKAFGKAKFGKSTITFTKLADINPEILIEIVKQGYDSMKSTG